MTDLATRIEPFMSWRTLVELGLAHLLPVVGFFLALVLVSHILRDRRSPSGTLAWLMAMVFIPYVAVPFYLLVGGRKVQQMIRSKATLPTIVPAPDCALPDDGNAFAPLGSGVFPPTCGNRVALVSSGEEAFSRMMALFERAATSIHVLMFILADDPTGRAVLEALTRKARGGVRVRLLLDALGSTKASKSLLRAFAQAGGEVAFFMPLMPLPLPRRGRANLRNHRKLILADGRRAMVGGMNFTVKYMGAAPAEDRWKDLMLEVEGAAVEHLERVFQSDWMFATGRQESLDERPVRVAPTSGAPADDTVVQIIESGPDVDGDPLHEGILSAVFHAGKRVWMVSPYFVPHEFLIEALCIASRRGVDVRVMVPKRSNHLLADLARESYLRQLQEAGAGVLLYDGTMLHAKAMLVDDIALVGSANMDMRSMFLNYEVALRVSGGRIVEALEDWMNELLEASRVRAVASNPPREFVEGIGRLFAPLL